MAVDEPTDKMRKALEAYNTGGSIDPTTGLPVWQAYKVPRSSYYDCLKWQRENPKIIQSVGIPSPQSWEDDDPNGGNGIRAPALGRPFAGLPIRDYNSFAFRFEDLCFHS